MTLAQDFEDFIKLLNLYKVEYMVVNDEHRTKGLPLYTAVKMGGTFPDIFIFLICPKARFIPHMKSFIQLLAFSLLISSIQAQDAPAENMLIYRAAATKLSDLIHTKLEIKLDYNKSWLYGKAWITGKQHFYSSDSLLLDARGMDIHQVSMVRNNGLAPLHYTYNGAKLKISLGRTYTARETYTVFIDYTSKPNELKSIGGRAITDDRGLYFINPTGIEKNKPTEVWTMGESESNSAWFPTIDKPNQKSTDEIVLTVSSKYLTLSNGKLISSKENGNGTRTDDWKMDLPHAPYLFFFAVGDYAVVKDHYKDKEVNYYVEHEYESVAKRIFGYTPEMMAYFSGILGVEFPWNKYAQITVRDFVSGSQENTTATAHSTYLQQNARELTEGNRYEVDIAHELFHQWFGDYVTTESWSNLTLNESFAEFSEILWTNYKHGRDAGDAVAYSQLRDYLSNNANAKLDLVRFYYEDREEMFDRVSYQKGALILNMLKNYVGDSAFFRSLNLYLTTNKFGSAEATQLRMAFETVTGQDLNWFWNQWYYGSGHPKLVIDYVYDDAAGKATVIVRQDQKTGKIFRIPLAIDVYEGENKSRNKVWIQNPADTFQFSYKTRPSLINVDGDKIVLCEREDHKTTANFIFQYQHAGLYRDRLESIIYCAKKQDEESARRMILAGLNDPSSQIRTQTLNILGNKTDSSLGYLVPALVSMAISDSDKITRGFAISYLGAFKNEKYKSLFLKATEDSSYFVAGRALAALVLLDTLKALEIARKIVHEQPKARLAGVVQTVLDDYGNESDAVAICDNFEMLVMFQKSSAYPGYIKYLRKIKDDGQVKMAVDQIVLYREKNRFFIPETRKAVNAALAALADQKASAGLTEQAAYILSQLN